MRKFLKYTTATSLLLMAFLFGGMYKTLDASAKNADYGSLRQFSQVLDIVEQYYVDEVKQKDLIMGALKGMLQDLDPHSTMMTEKEFKEMRETNTGKFSGIGIEMTMENGVIVVVAPIADTPAERAGMQSGDKILAIDGEYTEKMSLSEAATKMRGKKGTNVSLLVLHKNTTKPVTVELKRDDIPYYTVKAKELEKGYHWIRLARFSENTTKDLRAEIKKAQKSGAINGIILDLRNNPGGLVDQAVSVADMFLTKGPIMSMRGRNKSSDQVYEATKSKDDLNCPVIVLVNAGSASASEIVAGALRDQERAFIVGEQTFGKGSVQNVIPLPDGTGLKLTVALYYTPSGKSIQAEGIMPDFEVPYAVPASKDTDLFSIREKDLTKHLEVGADEVTNQSAIQNKNAIDEEAANMLKDDNQLRLALQFLKTLPVMQK